MMANDNSLILRDRYFLQKETCIEGQFKEGNDLENKKLINNDHYNGYELKRHLSFEKIDLKRHFPKKKKSY